MQCTKTESCLLHAWIGLLYECVEGDITRQAISNVLQRPEVPEVNMESTRDTSSLTVYSGSSYLRLCGSREDPTHIHSSWPVITLLGFSVSQGQQKSVCCLFDCFTALLADTHTHMQACVATATFFCRLKHKQPGSHRQTSCELELTHKNAHWNEPDGQRKVVEQSILHFNDFLLVNIFELGSNVIVLHKRPRSFEVHLAA
jgi:hypothetical protein